MVTLGSCFLFFNTFRDEPIVVMTSEEAAEVARLGSDINSLAIAGKVITTGRAGGLHKPPWGMSQAEP